MKYYLFDIGSGADFSECKQYRYALWRIWDTNLPCVMFIGLNPSTANENKNDQTISNVIRLSKKFGYGGCYMLNCWPYITSDPDLLIHDDKSDIINNATISAISIKCKDVVFAWGAFKIIKQKGRDKELMGMFPNALALKINKDGSPHHPLYLPKNIELKLFKNQ